MLRQLLIMVSFFAALPVYAATYRYDLVFDGDAIGELQAPLGQAPCFAGDACFPSDYRLPFGLFADLSVGQSTTATIDVDAGTVSIAGKSLDLFLTGDSPVTIWGFGLDESLSVDADRMNFVSSGLFSNPSGVCDTSNATRGLPRGFCGYFGYNAEFTVASVSTVPLPASAAMLLGALGLVGAWRLRRG